MSVMSCFVSFCSRAVDGKVTLQGNLDPCALYAPQVRHVSTCVHFNAEFSFDTPLSIDIYT